MSLVLWFYQAFIWMLKAKTDWFLCKDLLCIMLSDEWRLYAMFILFWGLRRLWLWCIIILRINKYKSRNKDPGAGDGGGHGWIISQEFLVVPWNLRILTCLPVDPSHADCELWDIWGSCVFICRYLDTLSLISAVRWSPLTSFYYSLPLSRKC